MTDDAPLAGLDDVPRAELQHSYGMADDVPGQLRAMQAGAWEGWYPPGMQLENHIVHQGTQSQAAVCTVPFLVRMALDPRLASRHRLVALLVEIAIGLDNNYLPNGYDPREDRAVPARLRGEAGDRPLHPAVPGQPDRRAALGLRLRADTVRHRWPGRRRRADGGRRPTAGEDRDDVIPDLRAYAGMVPDGQ